MRLFCKLFGHKFSAVALIVASIKSNAVNRSIISPNIIKCQRCKFSIDLHNPKAVESYNKGKN